MRRLRAIAVAAALVMCASAPASAQGWFAGYLGIDVDAEATIGLDKRTRRLIERFPDHIRKAVLDALKEGLPLIDKSVELYLSRIDRMLKDRIEDVGCVSVGTTINIEESIRRLFGSGSDPVEATKDAYVEYRQRFKANSKPDDFYDRYAGFIARAADLHCAVRETPSEAPRIVILETMGLAADRWRVWGGLRGDCDSAQACLVLRLNEMREFVRLSEKRDVSETNADERLAKVPAAEQIRALKWYPDGLSRYEQALLDLADIEAEIHAQRLKRHRAAKTILGDASTKLKAADQDLAKIAGELRRPDHRRIRTARLLLKSASEQAEKASKSVAGALEMSSTITDEAQKLTSDLGRLKEQIKAEGTRVNQIEENIREAERAFRSARELIRMENAPK